MYLWAENVAGMVEWKKCVQNFGGKDLQNVYFKDLTVYGSITLEWILE